MKGKSQVRYTSNGISKDSAVESPSQSTKQVHFQVEKQQGKTHYVPWKWMTTLSHYLLVTIDNSNTAEKPEQGVPGLSQGLLIASRGSI